jgi:diguanylate cyclase (GGDEF)-like protein/PAS domain S-box-containing protein
VFKSDLRPPQQADRVALVALGGITLAFFTWVAFGVGDALMRGTPIITEAFTIDHERTAARLFVVVLVLIATLVVEMIYSRTIKTESLLDRERRRLYAVYEQSPDAMVSFDSAGNVAYANPKAWAHLGAAEGSADALRSARARAYFDGLSGGALADALASGESYRATAREVVDGKDTWLHVTLYPVLDPEGAVESAVAVLHDETELHVAQERLVDSHHELERRVKERTRDLERANADLEIAAARHRAADTALQLSEDRYRQMVDGSPDMVVVFREGAVAFMNHEGTKLLGCEDPASVLGLSVGDLWEPNGSGFDREGLTRAVLEAGLANPVQVHLKRPDGGLVDVELSVVPLSADGTDSVQCVVRDITERVRAQKTIQRMAYYDPLTELPNRTLFRDRLATALAQARRRGESVAVAFVDLDDFKSINDALGHGVGDALLKVVGQRLRGLLRDEDTIARHSGDEFTVVARIADRASAEVLGKRIMDCLGRPVVVEGHTLQVTASVGMATFPEDGVLGTDLLHNADAAMYSAKKYGRSVCRLFVPEMTVDAGERLQLEQGLRSALQGRQFELFYQPQVDMRDNKVVGVEALLRWNHPTRGRLLPGAFLEIAEQAGLMGDIGHWVMMEACRQAAGWRADGLEFGRVAVNLSAREFVQQDIVENTRRALETTGLPAEMLELEITETVAVYSVDQVLAILHLLKEMGVRVAIDDFGTGYSSMSQVQRFPIQTIKIDQAFMRDVDMDLHSQAIASMLIQLCADLGLYVVAEGVEHPAQLKFLREKGCFIVQGNVFSGPVAADDVEPLLRSGVPIPVA